MQQHCSSRYMRNSSWTAFPLNTSTHCCPVVCSYPPCLCFLHAAKFLGASSKQESSLKLLATTFIRSTSLLWLSLCVTPHGWLLHHQNYGHQLCCHREHHSCHIVHCLINHETLNSFLQVPWLDIIVELEGRWGCNVGKESLVANSVIILSTTHWTVMICWKGRWIVPERL
jgi:hypothetical protein